MITLEEQTDEDIIASMNWLVSDFKKKFGKPPHNNAMREIKRRSKIMDCTKLEWMGNDAWQYIKDRD